MFGLNEALISFIRRQVGLRTDTANVNGSLHSKLAELRNYLGSYFAFKGAIASNTLRASADAERSTTNINPEIVKSIRMFMSGTIRVSFDLRDYTVSDIGGAVGYICINGVKAGTERNRIGGLYASFTEDIEISEGDYVQLAIRKFSSAETTVYCRNFRVYYDYRTVDHIVIEN